MRRIQITEEQKEKILDMISDENHRNVSTLNEENKTQKKRCVENIKNNVPPMILHYLDYELNDLPFEYKMMLNPDGALYRSVSNNQNGANKFIDYLRINLYQQFGIGRNSNLTTFIPGISRIACDDCKFYSFSLSIDGGKIVEFGRVLKLIDRKPKEIIGDIQIDSDFNGMSYDEFMGVFKDKIEEYIHQTKEKLSSPEYKITKTSEYTIIPIEDKIVKRGANKVLLPTDDGRRILDKFGRYTDWCVCANRFANEEFSQYLSNGGKMYICCKNGFENIHRPNTTETPLDEYGLSLLCVIIGKDGLPTNVTTRYNHDFGGENHSEMWEATHLQKLLQVDFFKVFKPRSNKELRALYLAEEKSKKISAQDQVDNKVNAGIMDAVVGGGLMEEDFLYENKADKMVNDYIKKHIGIDDFYGIRSFAMGVCHSVPNVRADKNYYLLGVIRLIVENNFFRRGDKYAEINNMLYNIKKSGDKLDNNLNGLTYDELMAKYFRKKSISSAHTVAPERKTPNGYIIKHIESYEDSENSGEEDWCITYEEEYFYSIISEGTCIYIVENPTMVEKCKGILSTPEYQPYIRLMANPHADAMGEYGSGEPPYDIFGLSRFVVLVNPQYVSVYSRWNIPDDLDGDFLNEFELEEVIGMPFSQAFPYVAPSEESVMEAEEWLELNEGAEPENDKYMIGSEGGNNDYFHVVNESNNDDSEIKPYLSKIANFMKDEGLNVYPYPKVTLNWGDQDGLFITTGYYMPSEKEVVLFCKDRHAKDILRSFAHEMIHHMQNLDGIDLHYTGNDDVKDNKNLEKLESEAYLKGNILFRKWTEYEKSKSGVLSESIISISQLRELTKDLDESLEPNEVDLSSFNIKKNLNPKFWKDEKLDSRIRMRLLDIADDFIEFLGVDWVKPEDITITGSLANYNWNEKHSDIDLHILMDFSKVDERTDFVENYFISQKNIWNDEHKDLKIFGFPIEVYVQDIKQKHTSNGVYSIEKNEWITEPKREKLAKTKVNKQNIKKEVSKYTIKIDKLVENFKSAKNDEYKLRKLYEKANALFDEIKKIRREDLNDSGNEINEGNIIFKALRRLGYIDKLDKIINKGYNKLNSLP